MFEPKKRRTPLPCSSRRRPVARAASPRTAFACKERTSGGVIAGRCGGAGERHESGRKAARNGAAFYAPFGKSSAPRRARHVVYGGMRAPDIGIQAAIRSAPHARAECVRTARQAAASCSHGGKPRTRRGKREKARAAAPASRLECGKRRAARATRRGETPHGGRRSATERNDRNRNAAPTAAPECSIRAPPPAARRTRRARAPRSDSDRIRRARAPRRSRSGCAPTGTSRCRRSYRRRP